MSVINAAIAGAVGLGTAAIGARASGKASEAQADAADASLLLQREQFNKQNKLAKNALGRTSKTNRQGYDRNKADAAREKSTLDALTSRRYTQGNALANTTYNRNLSGLSGTRDRILSDLGRDEVTSEANIRQHRDAALGLFKPAQTAGDNALGAYSFNLGIGKKPSNYTGMEMSEGTRFLMNEGRDEIEGGAAGAGGLYSGATLEALERKRMGLASLDKDNQQQQLFSLAGMGQSAANSMAGIYGNSSDDLVANRAYYGSADADTRGQYAGAISNLNDQNYARVAGNQGAYYDGMAGNTTGNTNRRIDNTNAFTQGTANAQNNRVSFGQSASQNYANGASNALANYGQAQATGAYGTASAINSGVNNAFGMYGMLGGGFPQVGQQNQNVLGSTQWPMNKPPMARPA